MNNDIFEGKWKQIRGKQKSGGANSLMTIWIRLKEIMKS